MTLAIIDLEWTAWKGSKNRNWSLEFEQREIVEFGFVSFKNFNTNNILKKNFHFKTKNEISNYFTNLTKITKQYNNANGKSFDLNFLEINRLMDNSKIILCNGLDKEVLIENFKMRNKRAPIFLNKIRDISPILSNYFNDKKEHVVSSELLDILKVKNNIKNKHRAADDAHIIFLALKYLIENGKIKILDLVG